MKLRFWIFSTFFVLQCLFINSIPAATVDEIRHMLSRATFGGSWVEIQALLKMDYEAAVKHLLDKARKRSQTPSPDWINQSPMQGKKPKQLSEAESRALLKERRRQAMEVKAWWFREMVQTGWSIDRRNRRYRFVHRHHDYGTKIFMGRTGNFNGDDIINIVLEQPDVAIYITEKIWCGIVSDTPDPEEVNRLAEIFRAHDYDIKPLMQALLTSNYFRDPKQYRLYVIMTDLIELQGGPPCPP